MRPFPILTTDFARLTERQKRLAGVGATPFAQLDEYHLYARFHETRPFAFRLAASIIDNAFLIDHLKAVARAKIRKLRRW